MGGIELAASKAAVRLDPGSGGRIASLKIDGAELLAPRVGSDWLLWGCYPMVPWAGRVRDGRFGFDGEEYQLELDLPRMPFTGWGIGPVGKLRTLGPCNLAWRDCGLSGVG